MLKFLKRWLGWEEDLEYFDPEDFKPVPRPRSVTAQMLAGKARKALTARKPRPSRAAPPAPQEAEPLEPDFNPYNTGKFDRSASWERISKNTR
jgi:hypothetical protein